MKLLRFFIFLFGLICAAFAVPKGFEGLPASLKPFVQNENDGTVVALVNDRKVLFQDIRFRYFNMLKAHPSLYPEKPLTQDIVSTYRKTAVEHQITKQVLTLEIERLKLYPTDPRVDEEIQHIRNNFGTQQAFDEKLKEQNADLALLKEETRFQMAVNALVALFDKEVPQPADPEVKQCYDTHLDAFKIPRKIRFSLIMVFQDPDAKPELMAKNLKLIRKIRADILARKNTFEFYAKNFSDDQATRQNGGDLGTLAEKDIKEPFTPVKDLWLGELSQVYSFAKGFYIAKVTEDVPESMMALPEVKERLREQIYSHALQQNREKRIAALRAQMKIELR